MGQLRAFILPSWSARRSSPTHLVFHQRALHPRCPLARPGTQRSTGVSARPQGASPHGRSHSQRPNPGHTGVSLVPLLCPCVTVLQGWTVETPGPRTDQEMGRMLSLPAHSLPPHCIRRTRVPDSRCWGGVCRQTGQVVLEAPSGMPTLRQVAEGHPGHPLTPHGLSSALPQPLPQSRL